MLIHARYQVEKKLGEGAFGITYLVRDINISRNKPPQRVLKELKIPIDQPLEVQEKVKEYFEREAEKLGELGVYDQIPNIFERFEEKDKIYLVQEFVQGQSLAAELAGKRLNEAQVIQLLREILTPLAIVHRHNVIHRDLKPDNIIRRSWDKKLFLIDFGAVKTLENDPARQTPETVLTWGIGTPGYMPDEQSKRHPRFCSDVYAVGMIAIQALTRIPPHLLPFNSDTLEVDWQKQTQISPQLQHYLETMVRYDFRQRYVNATEALENLPSATPVPPPQPPIAPTVVNPPKASSVPPAPSPPSPKPSVTPSPSQQKSSLKSTPSPSPLTRRRMLQLSAFGGVGLLGVFMINRLSGGDSSTNLPEVPAGKSLQEFDFEAVTVNDSGDIIDRQQGEAKYFTEDLGNGVTLDMVAIPGGTFVMGSPESEEGRFENESPQHSVTVQPFYMGRYQVTQAQWQAIMGNNPSHFGGDNRPVERVSWNDAVEFCEKLSEATGREYRLPSEAEWEYACCAIPSPPTPLPQGEGRVYPPFHFGETITTDLVNYNGNFTYANAPEGVDREETTPVGTFPPNAFGLYDMHGNVWEWCLDTWHDNYNGAPTDGSAWIENDNDYRVLRGGSWYFASFGCRSANRDSYSADNYGTGVGFRVLCVVPRSL